MNLTDRLINRANRLDIFDSTPNAGIGPLAPQSSAAVESGVRVVSAVESTQQALMSLMDDLESGTRALDDNVIFEMSQLVGSVNESLRRATMILKYIERANG